MPDSMFVEERRRVILDQLKHDGRVSVKALSALMNVSAVTIRQDLRALEEGGLLERTYGGAVRRQSIDIPPELSFQVRLSKCRDEKQAIAAAAAILVREGDSVGLDASTTAYTLVPHLKRFRKLTIVTNSLAIAQSFLGISGIRLLLPGGRLRHDSISLVGRPDTLPDINLNVGFFGARGVSLISGMSDVDAGEVTVKQAMIARCLAPTIICDGTKWGQVAPYTFLKTDHVRHIITSSDAPQVLVNQFCERGVRVDVVSAAG